MTETRATAMNPSRFENDQEIENSNQNLQLMSLLKDSTRQQHDAAEQGAFNDLLIKGRLSRDAYIRSLEQFFLVHRALERHLRRLLDQLPAFQRVLKDEQFQEPYLQEDLLFFGRDMNAIEPLDATRLFMQHINDLAETDPVALLGVHYVFEGSNNGSKFIARAVRRAYELFDGSGTRYLDPYGERQAELWRQFKEDMNAAPFTPQQTQSLVQAAGDTFQAVMELHRKLYESIEAKTTPAAAAASKAPAGKCPFHHGAPN